ncbi:TIGR00730 family Rossman fold protein [Falsirhodobacter sp. 20TX0035]|uniref:LOG family protein n=1 Tax=Falsirhodobacter sp. 20TX0035 TaxID=3022019 RepID=UPI00232D91F8|nr:TIGR00730 family Rossman fold protein [Falsirhodobacter sp. 20TX0035]MDB6453420.1 TIGR00730 family Rossman fold protein [Falsirhodobacter sp. 20TX0035]
MSYSMSVCVFCGSRPGNRPAYMTAASETGQMIARNGWRLVYGAGDVGLMGEVARGAASGETLGVIPEHLMAREQGRRDVTHFVVTDNMHVRKTVMYMNSDKIVVLPGGAGSLDEFFEVLTWRQIGLHSKPIFLLNTEGYWDPLMQVLNHTVREGFAEPGLLDFVRLAGSVPELEEALKG